MSNLVNEPISPNVTRIQRILQGSTNRQLLSLTHDDGIFCIDVNGFVTSQILKGFEDYEKTGHLYDVGVTGLKDNQGVGSKRFCTHDIGLSSIIDQILYENGILQMFEHMGSILEFAGTSQYWRFMKYERGGEHFPHYDSDFTWRGVDGKRCVTTHTVVVYFTDCRSGEFAFIKDAKNEGKKFNYPDFDSSDWDRQANEDEIIKKFLPKNGRILIFPHDRAHTVLPFTDENNSRIIARGDLIFKQS